mgnify:CR=1 FL=1
MPLYEYLCDTCQERAEILQKLGDEPVTICPNCGAALRKMISAPAFQFKGSGWYQTDYAKRSGGEGAGAKSEEKSGSANASESATATSGSKESATPAAPPAPAEKAMPPAATKASD